MTRSHYEKDPERVLFIPRGEPGRAKPARAHASYWPALAFVALGAGLWQCSSASSGNGVAGAAAKGGASGNGGASTSPSGASSGGTASTETSTDGMNAGGSGGGVAATGGEASGGAVAHGGSATGGTAAAGGVPAQGSAPGGSGGTISGGRAAGASGGSAGASGGVAGGAASLGGAAAGSSAAGGAGSGGASNCTPPNPPAAKDAVTLDMSTASGAPTYRASGFIYGIAEDGSQPPNSTLTDIKTQFFRVGGSDASCGGFVTGHYAPRWATVQAYYTKAQQIGVSVTILVSDLWGEDPACATPVFPGDGGDWTQYTTFMTQLISDVQAAGMTGPDVRWELQNEPDVPLFWNAPQSQWLETWKRGYQMVRAAIPNAVLEGPSTASGVSGQWFTAFLDYVKANDVVPDYVSWHGGDQANDGPTVRSELASRSLTVSNLDNNEYGAQNEQNPGHSAWYIARLERGNVNGLRSNWGGPNGGPTMYQTMADLVTLDWQPNSQWWIYKRYADQTGLRTTSTPGKSVDAVGFQDADKAQAIIVVGNNGGITGTVNVVIKNLPAWLQSNGSTKVLLEQMPTGDSALTAPTVVSSAAVPVNCGELTIAIDWTTATDGYAITLTPS
ncbi:MAG: hypothetical protein ABSB49_08050 [Polyangia bacterium]